MVCSSSGHDASPRGPRLVTAASRDAPPATAAARLEIDASKGSYQLLSLRSSRALPRRHPPMRRMSTMPSVATAPASPRLPIFDHIRLKTLTLSQLLLVSGHGHATDCHATNSHAYRRGQDQVTGLNDGIELISFPSTQSEGRNHIPSAIFTERGSEVS